MRPSAWEGGTMGVSLAVGNYAAQPFRLESLGLRVYCAEELCYCLRENAFLLDADLMSDRLLEWLSLECGLTQLSEELYPMVHKKGSLSAFVIRILEYVGFYGQDVLQEVERALKKGAGLNLLEKRKLRIDQLLEMGKFGVAVAEYDSLLKLWDASNQSGEVPGADLKSKLLHNKGVALAGLMRYGRAAEAFSQAYEADGSMESLRSYFAAKRMELSSSDYVALVAARPDCTDLTLQLEKDVERLNAKWAGEADYHRFHGRTWFRDEDEGGYLEENRQILRSLKETYRSMAAY